MDADLYEMPERAAEDSDPLPASRVMPALWGWVALLATPVIALLNLVLTYALVTPACNSASTKLLEIVTLASLLVSLVLIALAWQGGGPNGNVRRSHRVLRHRYVAIIAFYSAILFLPVIVTQWIAQHDGMPCLW